MYSEIKILAALQHNHLHLCRRHLATTSSAAAGRQWRLERGMGKCGNEYGPLTDIPDWAYADGTPAPLGTREIQRRELRKAVAQRAVELMEEMEFAKKAHQKRESAKEKSRQALLDRKLTKIAK